MRALVLGKGKSGAAAAATLREQGYEVESVEGFDLVVASPGVPVKSELQVGCEELRRRGVKLLAVTGSKGKSSVVKVVAEAIKRTGRRAVACGNYGIPVCEVAAEWPIGQSLTPNNRTIEQSEQSNSFRWAVVEVSSFQLETTNLPPDTFEAAAILNLQEDHLDRHGCVETYHALKRKLLTFAKRGIDGEALSAGSGRAGNVDAALWAGSYFDNEVLRGNAACAVELMRVAGLDDAEIAGAFHAFEPLPHRMNLVAEIDGVRYIDDSKATSLAALVAGVKMASSGTRTLGQSKQSANRSVRLIAGGLPKGDDPNSALSTLTERVKKVYLIGQCAKVFFSAWKSAVDCEICGTMEVAVEDAGREAEKGEVVLLSPGTASFDQFKSFGERGDAFARLVKKGKKE